MAADATLRRTLEGAADGLVYSSEADHPFAFFSTPLPPDALCSIEALDARRLAELLGVPPETPVGQRTLDDFFAPHIERSDAYDTRTQAIRPRYEALKATLRDHLRDVRVLRVGTVQVRCYVVGRDDAGNLAGLVTTAVET